MEKVLVFLITVLIMVSFSGCDAGLKIVGMEIEEYPDKIVYAKGVNEGLDLTGGVIKYLHKEKTTGKVDMLQREKYGDISHNIDFNKPGVYVVEISNGDFSCEFPIQVIDFDGCGHDKLVDFYYENFTQLSKVKNILLKKEEESIYIAVRDGVHIGADKIEYDKLFSKYEKEKLIDLMNNMRLVEIIKDNKMISFSFDGYQTRYSFIFDPDYKDENNGDNIINDYWYIDIMDLP